MKNFWNEFLTKAQAAKVYITVQLNNGQQIKGEILDFDETIIALDNSGKQFLVFRQAITTLTGIDIV